jgi:hypothetical protein
MRPGTYPDGVRSDGHAQGAKELTDLGAGQRLDDTPGNLDAKYEAMATR